MGAGVQGTELGSDIKGRCGLLAPMLMTVLALGLVSCSDEQDDSGNYSVDTQTGQISAQMALDDGIAEMYSGTVLQDHLPDGFTLFPGAELVSNTIFEKGDSNACFLSIQSDASPSKLAAHYRSEAEAAGMTITVSMSLPNSEMLAGEDAQGRRFSFDASRGQAVSEDEDEGGSDDEDAQSTAANAIKEGFTRASITISENF